MPPVLGALVLLTCLAPVRAAATSSCERYAVNGLSTGMTESMVRRKMGGEGVPNVIRNQNSEEASGVDYPGPPNDVYVQYDRRIDKGRSARTVLVRASMPFSAGAAQSLVNRFGPPQAGSASLAAGLQDGPAIWVDATCGVVMTAYRPSANWWTGAGGTLLQVETLEHARTGGASSEIASILSGARPPAAPPKPEAPAPSEAPTSPEVVVVPMDAQTTTDVSVAEAPPSDGALETPPVAPPPSPAPAQPIEVAKQTPEPEPVQATAPQPTEVVEQKVEPKAPPSPVTAPPPDAPAPQPIVAEQRLEPKTQAAAEVAPAPLSRQTPGTTGEAEPEPKTQTAAEVTPPPLSKQTPGTTGEVRKPATISTWRSELAPAPAAAPPASPLTIATWRSSAPAPAPSAAPAPAPPARADAPPEAITTATPAYPATAKWLGIKGHVKLEVVVRADGTVGSRPRVLSATPAGRGFEESAVAAVREWRFKPALRGGTPVESKTTVDLDFE